MEVSEAKKDHAIQLFLEAWDQRKEDLEAVQSERIRDLETEAAQLRREVEIASLKISQLEEERDCLEEQIQEASMQNSKFQHIKAALMDTLNEPALRERKTERLSQETPETKSHQPKFKPRPDKIHEDNPHKFVEGKRFFAETRERLSFEKFNKFLGYVKKINDKAIDTDTAIQEVGYLFGPTNKDLYQDFVGLLKRTV